MEQFSTIDVASEPVGIVISGPSRTEVVPRVLAYVWGPAPELVLETNDVISDGLNVHDLIATPRAA